MEKLKQSGNELWKKKKRNLDDMSRNEIPALDKNRQNSVEGSYDSKDESVQSHVTQSMKECWVM